MRRSILVLALILAPPTALAQTEVGARLQDAEAAASALQGPLDGAWVLRGANGEALLDLEIVDPVGGRGPLQAAWRDPRAASAGMGLVDRIERAGSRLSLSFVDGRHGAVALVLRRSRAGAWIGRMVDDGRSRAVVLTRG